MTRSRSDVRAGSTVADPKPAAAAIRRPGRPRSLTPSREHLDRREEIVTTAAEVFSRTGYDAGSLDDVARALDLTRPALYHYIRSKEEVLYLILDRAVTLAIARLSEIAEIHEPRRRLETFVRYQVTEIARDRGLFRALFDDRDAVGGRYRQMIARKERIYLKALGKCVQDAIEDGALPRADPRYATQLVLGMASWVYKWFDPERDDADAVAESCVRLLLGEGGGERPAPGR
jgi:TetR/AcrR family transcriptional regulator, cholesterol catabolism regulator